MTLIRPAIAILVFAAFASASAAAQAVPAAPDLDAIARQVIARENVVGASVLVARGDRNRPASERGECAVH